MDACVGLIYQALCVARGCRWANDFCHNPAERANTTSVLVNLVGAEEQEGNSWYFAIGIALGILVVVGICSVLLYLCCCHCSTSDPIYLSPPIGKELTPLPATKEMTPPPSAPDASMSTDHQHDSHEYEEVMDDEEDPLRAMTKGTFGSITLQSSSALPYSSTTSGETTTLTLPEEVVSFCEGGMNTASSTPSLTPSDASDVWLPSQVDTTTGPGNLGTIGSPNMIPLKPTLPSSNARATISSSVSGLQTSAIPPRNPGTATSSAPSAGTELCAAVVKSEPHQSSSMSFTELHSPAHLGTSTKRRAPLVPVSHPLLKSSPTNPLSGTSSSFNPPAASTPVLPMPQTSNQPSAPTEGAATELPGPSTGTSAPRSRFGDLPAFHMALRKLSKPSPGEKRGTTRGKGKRGRGGRGGRGRAD